MRRTLLATALLVLPLTTAKKDYAEYKLSSLQRLLDVRGLTCNGCASKEDWVAAVRQHVQLEKRPVVPELEAAYRERAAYAKRAKEFSMTREDFFTQLRAEADEVTMVPELDDASAERLWRSYQQQLAEGTVEFEDGHARFLLPFTHRLASYLYPWVADAVEGAFDECRRLPATPHRRAMRHADPPLRHPCHRKVYMRLPAGRRRDFEALVAWLVETGALQALIVLLLSILVVDLGLDHLRRRRRGGGAFEKTAERPPAGSEASGSGAEEDEQGQKQ